MRYTSRINGFTIGSLYITIEPLSATGRYWFPVNYIQQRDPTAESDTEIGTKMVCIDIGDPHDTAKFMSADARCGWVVRPRSILKLVD